jgi:hypothetical protein
MTKEEALELLKNSDLLKPIEDEEDEGVTLLRFIGEYIGERNGAFIFSVYYYSSVDPVDPTYAFPCSVNSETKKISFASAPYSENELKWVQEHCEKINISVE